MYNSTVVTTTHGPVRGRIVSGVVSFKGIRYGADTATHRFEPPRAPAPWTETVNAFEFGPNAIKLNSTDRAKDLPSALTSPENRDAATSADTSSAAEIITNAWGRP